MARSRPLQRVHCPRASQIYPLAGRSCSGKLSLLTGSETWRAPARASAPSTQGTPHMRRIIRLAVGATTALAAVAGCAASTAHPTRSFDLQAHRGGIALTVENTLAAFGRALGLGVSTLELDTQVTEDGYAVVTHDRDPDPRKSTDTFPAFPGDPEYPYVPGVRYVKDLTLAQVRTLACGSTP